MVTFSLSIRKPILTGFQPSNPTPIPAISAQEFLAMAISSRLIKSFSRLLFPVVLLISAAVVSGSVWLVYSASRPYKATYLVTPGQYGQLSTRAAQVTEETWSNPDGSSSRGWLLRGVDNAPAVILLHKYNADRSHMLNLGVKLNESTNFTVLMPDLRAHGENPTVQNASFGGCEAEDISASVAFLRSLRNENQIALVGKNIGVFGVELGSLAALAEAVKNQDIKAIAIDSVPQDSDEVLRETVGRRYPFASVVTKRLANLGTYVYYYDGCYRREPACETAKKLQNRDVLLLAGIDEQNLQDSTTRLSKCFAPNNNIDSKFDLSPSGYNIINASIEQSEGYDQRLIDFFRNSLSK